MDDKYYLVLILTVATIAAGLGYLQELSSDQSPTYIQYYDYPYGPNHSLIKLPIITCYNAYWWDIRNSMDRNKYLAGSDFYYNGSNGFCHKEWH